MKSLILLASVSAVLIGLPARAEFNGSNSSGSNTTSFSGSSNSIWSSDRAPVKPTPQPVVAVAEVKPVPVVVLEVKPSEQPCIIPLEPEQPYVKPVETESVETEVKPLGSATPKPKYPKSKAPRGRG